MKVNKFAWKQAKSRVHMNDTPEWRRMTLLMEEAEKRANKLGHQLGFWAIWMGEIARSQCKTCDLGVGCLLHPFPNEEEISGWAVKDECPKKKVKV